MSVASFTDAWIETTSTATTVKVPLVASFTDAWIETVKLSRISHMEIVASFTDAWIETLEERIRLFLGGRVASFTDAWIETLGAPVIIYVIVSHLLQMRGLKL